MNRYERKGQALSGNLVYKCHYCDEPILRSRVLNAESDGEKFLIEHYCECKDFVISSRYTMNMPAIRRLFTGWPYVPEGRVPSNQDIDAEVAVFAFDLDGLETVEEFEWMCAARSRLGKEPERASKEES